MFLALFLIAQANSLFGLATTPGNDGDSRIVTVQTFITAQVRGDYPSARALLSSDARVWYGKREGPGTPWRSPDDWTSWDLLFHRELVYWEFEAIDSGVTASVSEMSDFYRLIDRPAQRLRVTWWLDDSGKLKGALFESLPENSKAKDRLGDFEDWARKNRRSELEYVMPNGALDPTDDRPQRLRTLLLEWRKATGLPPVDLTRGSKT